MLKYICTIALSIFLTFCSANAGSQEAYQAFQKGDYKSAYNKWLPLAQNGDAASQIGLGLIYGNGFGVSQNSKKSIYWYKLAAKQGHAEAQYMLGAIYYTGENFPRDYKKALHWLTLAANQNQSTAQFFLSVMYSRGKGVLHNYKRSIYWLSLAAANGLAEAQYILSKRFTEGKGVLQDYVKAHMWANIAASNGANSDIGNVIATYLTPTQLEQAQRMARECVENNYKGC